MEVKKIVYEKLKKLTNKKFDDKTNIFSIGIDSLDLVELVTDAEEEFDITITDEDLEKFKTVEDIIKGIEKQLK